METSRTNADSKSSLWQSLQDFRASHNLEELEIEADVFADVRDLTSGREKESPTGINSDRDAKLWDKTADY